MSRKLRGLDIRRDVVSAVVVKSGIKGSWIEGHTHVPISASGQSFDEALRRSLDIITEQIQVSDAVCIVSLPAADVTYRNMKAPFKEVKKLRQILPFELETDLPYQAEDIAFDFKVLENALDNQNPLLFAAVIEKQRVAALVDLLKQFDMQPDILTVGGYAMGQYLARLTREKQNRVFLDIGSVNATMVLSLSGDVCLVRTFPLVDAEKQGMDLLCSQVNQTLLAFEQKTGLNCSMDDIRITGPGSTDTDIEPLFEKALGAPVGHVDLMEMSPKIRRSLRGEDWQPRLMDGALSLALSELSGFDSFNFRRGRMGMEKVWIENKKDILKTCCLGGFVALLFLGYSIVSTYTLKQRVEAKKSEIVAVFQSTFPEVTQIVDPVHQMRMKLEAAEKNISFPGELNSAVKTIDILNDISRLIPEKQDVELVSIIVGSDHVVVSGNTDTFNAVDDMKSGLEGSDIFESVSISSANMDKTGKRVRFKLKVAL